MVILTALPGEYAAVRRHLRSLREVEHRGSLYERARFGSGERAWEVIIAEIGAGNMGAAAQAERMISFFEPTVALFVGVAGGIKDVQLGDVVVATKIYNYASGKALEELQTRPDVLVGAYELEERVKAERRKTGWLRRLGDKRPESAPRIFLAPIAAGEQVVASRLSDTFKLVRKHYSDAAAIEMEGIGFLRAAHANAPVKALVIRGISDLVDDKAAHDSAGWQLRAAHHAAAFAFEILAQLSPTKAAKAKAARSRKSAQPRAAASRPALSRAPYGAPIQKSEILLSNLLPVTGYAAKLYLAETNLRRPSEVWAAFRELDLICPGEWLLREKRILSLHDLSEGPWLNLCDQGTVEAFDTSEWASSPDPDRRRDFVQLLNHALRRKLYPEVTFRKDLEIYAFSPPPDALPDQWRYEGSEGAPRLTVFKKYTTEYQDKAFVHYRHHAFRGQFRCYEGQWYLEVTPTYLFTEDGLRVHRRHEDLLKGIKRFDKNQAVCAQLRLWADRLGPGSELNRPAYPFLTFGSLPEVSLDVGIPDNEWLAHSDEVEDEDQTDESSSIDMST